MKPCVLFILHLPPPVHGAATVGKYIRESTFINSYIEADFINLATNNILQESGKGGFKKIGKLIQIQIKILRALLHKKYELCYMTLTASGPGFYKDLFIIFILKLFNKRIIYHFHNKGIVSARKKWFNNYLYRFALKNNKCILLSRFLYPEVQPYIKDSDIYYCANGIPPYPQGAYQESIINEEIIKPCRLLFLSNMQEEKGVLILLEACKILKKRSINFECHFVGAWSDITEEAFNDKVFKSNLAEMVFAHGPKYNQDKIAFLNNADIFLFPTFYKYETFGLVNLEAMQFNLPVISTNEGGIPDVVIDGVTGFLVPQKNDMALADKIQTLIQNPDLRKQMGKAGAQRYKEHFSLKIFEYNFVQVIKNAVIDIN